jgi:hypothetical protein
MREGWWTENDLESKFMRIGGKGRTTKNFFEDIRCGGKRGDWKW